MKHRQTLVCFVILAVFWLATASLAAPVNVSLSPSSGTFDGQRGYIFSSTYSGPDGQGRLANCYLQINTSPDSKDSLIYVRYDATENKLYLRSDDNTTWLGGFAPGSRNVIKNHYCALYCVDTTVSRYAKNELKVNWCIASEPSVALRRCFGWMKAVDEAGLAADWDQMSSAPITFALSLTPVSEGTRFYFQPRGGTYFKPQTVGISRCETENCFVHYTTDGSEPTLKSDLYTTAIELSKNTTVKAKAFGPNGATSPTTTAQYEFLVRPPVFNTPGGNFISGQLITISCPTTGVEIHYTRDGSEPTQNSSKFDPKSDSPIAITSIGTTKLRAKAFKPGWTASEEISADYTINGGKYVDSHASGPVRDGSSWKTAFLTIQDALKAASKGQEVWVAATDEDKTYQSCTLKAGVQLLGGFSGKELCREDRDWSRNTTIIKPAAGWSYSVKGDSTIGADTLIDGFTIIGDPGSYGIYCDNSSPTISHTTIIGAEDGIHCSGTRAQPLILNNVIHHNRGQGIVCSAAATIVNNTIADNAGAGINGGAESPTIANNIICGNKAGVSGTSGSPDLSHNCVYGNGRQDYVGVSKANSDIAQNPNFLAESYRLKATSPCVDRGNDGVEHYCETDMEGRLRRRGLIDIGAYEFNRSVWLSNFENWTCVVDASEPDRDAVSNLARRDSICLTESWNYAREFRPQDFAALNPGLKIYRIWSCEKAPWESDWTNASPNKALPPGIEKHERLQTPLFWQDIESKGWWVFDSVGKSVRSGSDTHWMNMGLKAMQDSYIGNVLARTKTDTKSYPGFTGIISDACVPCLSWYLNGQPFPTSYVDDEDWFNSAYKPFSDYLLSQCKKKGLRFIRNLGSCASYDDQEGDCERMEGPPRWARKGVDGVIYEQWSVDWNGNWLSGKQIEQRITSYAKDPLEAWIGDMGVRDSRLDVKTGKLDDDPAYYNKQLVSLAMYYIALPPGRTDHTYNHYKKNQVYWQPRLTKDKTTSGNFDIYNFDIGVPLQERVKNGSSYAWSRNYSHGLVLLNYDKVEVAFPLDRVYYDLNGQQYKGSQHLPAHSALILCTDNRSL